MPQDYDMEIDGVHYNVHWDKPTPPTQTDAQQMAISARRNPEHIKAANKITPSVTLDSTGHFVPTTGKIYPGVGKAPDPFVGEKISGYQRANAGTLEPQTAYGKWNQIQPGAPMNPYPGPGDPLAPKLSKAQSAAKDTEAKRQQMNAALATRAGQIAKQKVSEGPSHTRTADLPPDASLTDKVARWMEENVMTTEGAQVARTRQGGKGQGTFLQQVAPEVSDWLTNAGQSGLNAVFSGLSQSVVPGAVSPETSVPKHVSDFNRGLASMVPGMVSPEMALIIGGTTALGAANEGLGATAARGASNAAGLAEASSTAAGGAKLAQASTRAAKIGQIAGEAQAGVKGMQAGVSGGFAADMLRHGVPAIVEGLQKGDGEKLGQGVGSVVMAALAAKHASEGVPAEEATAPGPHPDAEAQRAALSNAQQNAVRLNLKPGDTAYTPDGVKVKVTSVGKETVKAKTADGQTVNLPRMSGTFGNVKPTATETAPAATETAQTATPGLPTLPAETSPTGVTPGLPLPHENIANRITALINQIQPPEQAAETPTATETLQEPQTPVVPISPNLDLPPESPFGAKATVTPPAETKSETPPITPETPQAPAGPITGAKNAITEKELADMGMAPVERQAYIGIQEAATRGKAAIDSGAVDPQKLAAEVAANPRPIDATEVGVLVSERLRLKQEYHAREAALDDARIIGDKARIEQAEAALAETKAGFDENSNALVKSGTEWSAAGNARKMVSLDYSFLPEVLERSREAKGGALTPEEEKPIAANVKALAETNDKLEKAQSEGGAVPTDAEAKAEAEKQVEAVKKSISRSAKKEDIKAQRLKDQAELMRILTGKGEVTTNAGAKPIADAATLIAKIITARIHEGALTLADAVAKTRADFPMLSERQIHDAFSGYGKKASSSVASAKAKLLQAMRTEAMWTSKLADEQAGIDTRIKKNPGAPNDTPKGVQLRKQVEAAQKVRTDAEKAVARAQRAADAQAKREATIQAKIDNIKQQLSTKNLKPTEQRTPAQKSALMKELADWQKKLAAERRGQTRAASIEKEIADIEQQLKSKNLKPQQTQPPKAKSELEAKLADARSRLAIERRGQNRTAAIQKEIADIEEQLRTKNLKPQEKPAAKTKTDLENQLADARKRLAAERRAQKPAPTQEAIDAAKAKRADAQNARLEKQRQAKIDDLKQQLETGQLKATAKRPKPTPTDLQQELADLQKKVATERRHQGAKPPPTTEELNQAQDLRDTAKLQARVDKHARDIIDLSEQLRTGNFKPAAQRAAPPEIIQRLMEQKQFLNAQIKMQMENLKPKTFTEKALSVGRNFKLSGIAVFEKLGGASLWAIPVESLGELVGKPFEQIRVKGQKLGDVAGRTGSGKSVVTRVRGMVSRQALANAKQTIIKGFNTIDSQAELATGKPSMHTDDFLGKVGRLHGAVKAFLQTGEYNASLEARLDKLDKQGVDINDPDVRFKAGLQAAVDAQNVILKGENAASEALNRGFAMLQRNPHGGVRLAGAALQSLMPIVKVPLNYLGKTADMTGFGLARGLWEQGKASLSKEPMTPRQAEDIIKAYKYGSLGLVAMYLGLKQPSFLKSAGFYTRNMKQNPDNSEAEMKENEFQVGGVTMPHVSSHSPFLDAVQFWATVRRGFEQAKVEESDTAGQVGTGLYQGVAGLMKQAPGLETTVNMGAALTGDSNQVQKVLGEYTRGMTIPQAAQEGAKQFDKDTPWWDLFHGQANRRDESSIQNVVQAGIPGLRNLVPPPKDRNDSSATPAQLMEQMKAKMHPELPRVKF